MAITIILQNFIKTGVNGNALKRQPSQPAIKFEKLLKNQKIKFKKEIVEYSKAPKLNIKENVSGSWQSKGIFFNEETDPKTKCVVFTY